MAIKALEKGGFSEVVSNVELAYIKEIRKVDPEKADKYEKDEATRYTLRVPSSDEQATLANLMQPTRGNGTYTFPRMGEAMAYAVHVGLVNWHNINNADGEGALPFKGRKDDQGRVIGAHDSDLAALPESERQTILDGVNAMLQVAVRDLP